jgi:hypothetical protein
MLDSPGWRAESMGVRDNGASGRRPDGRQQLCGALTCRMADTREEAAELRIARVKALDGQNLVGLVTYLLARYPDTFPPMLDEALSTISPKAD